MGLVENYREYIFEVFQRRNLIIYNGGIVNSIYISKVAQPFKDMVKLGDKIKIDRIYLENAINLFEKFFLILAAELWKKLEPNNINRALLIQIAYNHLCLERWEMAESLSYFTMKDKGLPEKQVLGAQINYWQSLKWQGRFNEIKEQVERADFSAKNEIFQLTKFALLDNNYEFYNLLPKVLESGKLTRTDLKTWPIFREMRNDPIYGQYQDDVITDKSE